MGFDETELADMRSAAALHFVDASTEESFAEAAFVQAYVPFVLMMCCVMYASALLLFFSTDASTHKPAHPVAGCPCS